MIVVWHCDIAPPPAQRWPGNLGVPVLVKTRNIKVHLGVCLFLWEKFSRYFCDIYSFVDFCQLSGNM
jgi:hypothetical protein